MSINKADALSQLRKAKGAHIKWRAYAQAMVSGVDVSKEKVPVEHTNCAFGKWYHNEGKQELGHLPAYEGIYTPHEMLHEIYKRIFDVINSPGPGGFFTSRATRQQNKMLLARQYMCELVGVSETLLKAVEILEEEIKEQID